MFFQTLRRESLAAIGLIALVLMGAVAASGQSSNQDLPTPVRGYEINGTIPALDVGDSRLTRHFYAFHGTHGDLLVTVESRNLSGDVDIFTAVNFKPLVKIPMYSQASSSMTTKSIYMRAEDTLVLRVEARSPNDDIGVYRIRFGGAFAPFSGGIPVAETDDETTEAEKSAALPKRRGTKRVSSVGARVEEPALTMTPEPPAAVEEKRTEAAKSSEEPAKSVKNRRATARPPARSRSTVRTAKPKSPPKSARADKEKQPESDEIPGPKPEPGAETETKPSAPPAEAVKQPTASEPARPEVLGLQPGSHLIIVEVDGTRIDRPMATIRRVTIENGWIVMVLKNGRIERILMTDVARMSIEP